MYCICIFIINFAANSQHKSNESDSQGMSIHCMCLCCSHTVPMGHVCFLPTAAEDAMKSMAHSSAVSDGDSM